MNTDAATNGLERVIISGGGTGGSTGSSPAGQQMSQAPLLPAQHPVAVPPVSWTLKGVLRGNGLVHVLWHLSLKHTLWHPSGTFTTSAQHSSILHDAVSHSLPDTSGNFSCVFAGHVNASHLSLTFSLSASQQSVISHGPLHTLVPTHV